MKLLDTHYATSAFYTAGDHELGILASAASTLNISSAALGR
jgi:hypothetical protein